MTEPYKGLTPQEMRTMSERYFETDEDVAAMLIEVVHELQQLRAVLKSIDNSLVRLEANAS